ncbi:hypothetical protein KDL45_03825 [bacterium]|nr:hypothetical protein [bacterium]
MANTATYPDTWIAEDRRLFWRNVAYVLVILVWALLVYARIYQARFFLDDYLHLHLTAKIDNPLAPFTYDVMMGAFFRPGVFWFWKINYLFGGTNPAIYYAFNIGLLALGALLLMQVVQHLTGRKSVAAIATLLFAVSPVTAVGLLWLSNRFDLLGAAFFLGSWLLFLRFLKMRRTRQLAASVLLGAMAYFCKEITVTLPVVLAASGLFVFWHRATLPRDLAWRVVAVTVPHFLAAAVFVLWRYAILGSMGGYVGETRVALSLDYLGRLIAFFGSYVWVFHRPWILALVMAWIVAILARRRIRAIVADNPVAWFGFAVMIVTALPLLMVLRVEAVMSYQTPRFFFLPGIGACIFLAGLYDPAHPAWRRRLAATLIGVLALGFSINSYLFTNVTRDKTVRAEARVRALADFTAENLPAGGGEAIVYACREGQDVALDSAVKLYRPELRSRAFVVNCNQSTQVIADQKLYDARGEDLTFPPTFTKNPNRYEDLIYGIVTTTPREIMNNYTEKSAVFAAGPMTHGAYAWLDQKQLERRLWDLGLVHATVEGE